MRLAVLSNIFPLYEVHDAELFTQTMIPNEIISVEKYIHLQGRFRHFTKQDINDYQKMVNERFERLQERFEKSKA
jgi:pyruvate/2-oxoacid:ferredoxin oxidoreductase beta subunit